MLAHFLPIVTGFMGPLVIYIIKRESRFISFHAIQALLWQAIYFVFSLIGVAVWIALFVGTIATHLGSGGSKAPPLVIFLFFPLIWLFFAGGWVVTLTLGIVYGIKANQGEWANYPIIGRWAHRLIRV